MKAFIEYTDSFGGDANYSWCQRHSFNAEGMSDLAVIRKAKKMLDLNGVRGQTTKLGDMIEFRPNRMNTIMFITFQES